MATLTVYPNANPETTSMDGHIGRNGVDQTFAAIRSGLATMSGDADADTYLYLSASVTTNQFSDMRRFLYLFDTSPIGAGATITAATLSFVAIAKTNQLGSPDVVVVSSDPAINTGVTAEQDWANQGTTSFGSVAYASVDVSGTVYTDITLNSSGLAAISLTGITKFGLRQSWDQSGTFGGTWIANNVTYFQINMADNASGTAKAPKLVVTYTVAAPDLSVNLTEPILGQSTF